MVTQNSQGVFSKPNLINRADITRGVWVDGGIKTNRGHTYRNLTECSCQYLDRFSEQGHLIREAYADAVVKLIRSFGSKPEIKVAMVGTGGLLQEAIILSKLFQETLPSNNLFLHCVDTSYVVGDSRIQAFAEYAKTICPKGVQIQVGGWNALEAFEANVIAFESRCPDLVVGIDTTFQTVQLADYEWGRDIPKALFVQWIQRRDSYSFQVFARNGAESLKAKEFAANEAAASAAYIRDAH